MDLGAKVRHTAGELYGQAKAKAAAGPMAGKIRDLSSKAAAAVKDAQARRPEHR